MYGKVFSSMYDGTLATRGPWQALVTFQQLIVLSDRDGVVDMTSEAIARRTSIPLEIIEAGIGALLQPDPRSRTPAEEGRRIVPLEDHRDWGWQIVNHAKYQAMRSAEERREYLRIAQANRRERLKALSTPVNNVNHASTMSTVSTPTPTDAPAPAPASSRKEDGSPAQAPRTPPTRAPVPEFLDDENENTIPERALVKLSPRFELPSGWGNDAEALGWTPADILREAVKFRQYWVDGAGKGKARSVKGWRQSWRNWLSKAERFKR